MRHQVNSFGRQYYLVLVFSVLFQICSIPAKGDQDSSDNLAKVKQTVTTVSENLAQATSHFAALQQNAVRAKARTPVSVAPSSIPSLPGIDNSSRAVRLRGLKAVFPDLDLRGNGRTGTATLIKARKLYDRRSLRTAKTLTTGDADRDTGLACLHEYRDLLKIENAHAEFASSKTSLRDALGNTHLRFGQTYRGLRIWGREALVHLDAAGSVYLVEAEVQPTPTIDTTPILTGREAEEKAAVDFGPSDSVQSELVIDVDDWGLCRLAYYVTVRRGMITWIYFVDARTGTVLKKRDDTRYEAVAASGTGLAGRSVNFSAWWENGKYYLIDTSLQSHQTNPVVAQKNLGTGNMVLGDLKGGGDLGKAVFVTSSSAAAGWDTYAVSALENLKAAEAYYRRTFALNSYDNQGGTIMVFVHWYEADAGADNAAWISNNSCFVFGDGERDYSCARALDVVAHEYTHAVTGRIVDLEYQDQSGALCEALADFFGDMVDREDWQHGEDAVKDGSGCRRDFANPANGATSQRLRELGLGPCPSHMSEYLSRDKLSAFVNADNGGVHINLTIPGHALYLLAEGLTATGKGTSVGREKAEKIVFGALPHLKATSGFLDARRATAQSAEELYGANSAEVTAVNAAWDEVGVTDDGGSSDPGGGEITPVTGDEFLVYLYSNGGAYYLGQRAADGTEYQMSTQAVSPSCRPAVAVPADGPPYALYVDESHNIRFVSLSTSVQMDQALTTDGNTRTIAKSLDGRYLALVSKDAEDIIGYVDDTLPAGERAKAMVVRWPNEVGSALGKIKAIGSIEFDISGEYLIFDCMSEIMLEGQSTVQYWNIGMVHIPTQKVSSLVLSYPQGFDIRNPMASSVNANRLAFDIFETAAGRCRTVVAELASNQIGQVCEEAASAHQGWGAFTGDDAAMAVQYQNNLVRVPLVKQDGILIGDFANRQVLKTGCLFPRYYRKGTRSVKPKIELSGTALAFGKVNLGQTLTKSFTITNKGTFKLALKNFQLSDTTRFAHNGYATSLDPNGSLKISVSFKPAAAEVKTATLSVLSDDPETAKMDVSLSGEGVAGGGGSGGPTVISTYPPDNSTSFSRSMTYYRISFDRAIVPGEQFLKISMKEKLWGGTVSIHCQIDANGKDLMIYRDSELTESTLYEITVPANAVKDASGNGLAAERKVSFMTDGGSSAPAGCGSGGCGTGSLVLLPFMMAPWYGLKLSIGRRKRRMSAR